MEKSEVLRIKKQPTNPKEKHRNRINQKISKSLIQDNETQLPNSNNPISGISEIQGFQHISNNVQNPQSGIQYGNPVLMNNIQGQNVPITNQIMPMTNIPLEFGIIPIQIICPYCRTNSLSRIEKNFNCMACCCCGFKIVFFICLAPCGACQKIDCSEECDCKCCHDVNHYCPNCGKNVGTWDSLKKNCPNFDTACLC